MGRGGCIVEMQCPLKVRRAINDCFQDFDVRMVMPLAIRANYVSRTIDKIEQCWARISHASMMRDLDRVEQHGFGTRIQSTERRHRVVRPRITQEQNAIGLMFEDESDRTAVDDR